ncbi:hypothetical protein DBZ45_00445 [Arthrobacter globiformis]|uniref:Uncharacterized protein n=1 Tax=Arthrobacter globiformis TaxID=1665 RepID=A0A328HQN7_ARTGO|nr:hypothetical protein DBZ45_00445 [Arthrobacter globiformis]
MVAFSPAALHSWAPAAVDCGASGAEEVVAGEAGCDWEVEEEADGGADVSGAACVLGVVEPVAGSVVPWVAGWLGPQAVSSSARAAAAVVHISPLVIR